MFEKGMGSARRLGVRPCMIDKTKYKACIGVPSF